VAVVFRKLETDLTTLRLDLNAGIGAASGFLLFSDFDIGTSVAGGEFLSSPPNPEAIQVGVTRGLVQMRFRLSARHTSYDNLVALAQSLATELDIPGPYQFNPSGGSARYFDAWRADIPGLLRGQDIALGKIITLLQDHDGLPITLWRTALYGAKVTGTPTAVSNDPASSGKRMTVNVTGNLPTRINLKGQPEAGSNIVRVRVARRSYGNLSDFRGVWFKQGESASLGTDTSSVADGGASGGNMARTTFATVPTMIRRERFSFTPADLTAIEGRFRVFARYKLPTTGAFTVLMKWGPSAADPAPFSCDEIPLVTSAAASSTYYTVPLGEVTVERGLGTTYGLTVDVFARRDSGSANLDLDHIFLMPAGATPSVRGDQLLTATVRGFNDVFGPAPETWLGKDLTTVAKPTGRSAGVVDGTRMKLRQIGDAAGSPPDTGFMLGAGRHTVLADVTLERDDAAGVGATLGTFNVRNLTGAEGTDIGNRSLALPAHVNRVRSVFRLDVDDPGAAVQFQVRRQSVAAATIWVHSITHTALKTMTSSRRVHLDGEHGMVSGRPAAFVSDASDVFYEPLTVEGAWVIGYPGDNEICVDYGDSPPLNTEGLDVREVAAQSVLARSLTWTPSFFPRYSH